MDELNEETRQRSVPSRVARRSTPTPAPQSKTRTAATIAKTGLLAALAGATVIAPMTGSLAPTLWADDMSEDSLGQSWADLHDHSLIPDSHSLRYNPAAASRDAVRNPLDSDRCLRTDESANGIRTAMAEQPEPLAPALVWPLRRGTFHYTSPFGYRTHPIFGVTRLHSGVDMAGSRGTTVMAASDGVVISRGWSGGLGYAVMIYHPHLGITTAYGHMISGSSPLSVGQEVKAGDRVGSLGSTGNSTGPHLHFEVRKGRTVSASTAVDPRSWMNNHGATDIDDVAQPCS